ncbi:MAG: hypothetical protein KC516_04490 [Nanoarchaeota archaeon]|nr:hypothetical protein [Nanoarchaeota archaeon]
MTEKNLRGKYEESIRNFNKWIDKIEDESLRLKIITARQDTEKYVKKVLSQYEKLQKNYEETIKTKNKEIELKDSFLELTLKERQLEIEKEGLNKEIINLLPKD